MEKSEDTNSKSDIIFKKSCELVPNQPIHIETSFEYQKGKNEKSALSNFYLKKRKPVLDTNSPNSKQILQLSDQTKHCNNGSSKIIDLTEDQPYRDSKFGNLIKSFILKKKNVFNVLMPATEFRYRDQKHPGKRKKNFSWSEDQDQLILQFVSQKGKKWGVLGKILSRDPILCKNRFLFLSGEPEPLFWSSKDDYLLLLGSNALKNRWTQLCQHFPGRNRFNLKQRYHYIVSKQEIAKKLEEKLQEVKESVLRGKKLRFETNDERENYYLSLIYIRSAWIDKTSNFADNFKKKLFLRNGKKKDERQGIIPFWDTKKWNDEFNLE